MSSQPHSDHGYSCGDPSSTSLTQTINPFFEKLQQLREKQLYCDLVLVVQGAKFSCHRAVIASWSPYIHSMLNMKNVEKEMFQVNFNNVSVFAAVLNYMYTNVLDLQEVNLIQVLHLATSFQIQPLREMCEGSLRCNLHVGNIISTFQLARKFQLSSLEDFSLTYLQMHLPDAVKQNDFLNLSAMRFNNFLSSGFVTTLKPEVKLFLIISWLGYDVKDREQYFVVLLGHIDWSTVANDFLTEISQTENFFTTNESSLYLLLQTLHSSGISLGPYTNAFADLRSKYSYLLSQVVQSSVWKTTPEVFTPVTVTHSAVSNLSRSRFHPTGMSVGVQTEKTGESDKFHTYQQEDQNSLDKAEPDWDEGNGEDEQAVAYEEEETPRRRTSSRKSLRPKKLTRIKKKSRKSRKLKDTKLKEGHDENDSVPRRESSRVPKPIVYEGFDNGEESDNAWEETEPVKDEDDPQDIAAEEVPVKLEEEQEQDEEQNEEEDEIRFHRMAHNLQFENQDQDQDPDQEEENNDGNEEFDEDEEETTDAPDVKKRRRGRPKKGMEPEKQKCDKCSYVARTVGKLRNHMKKTHEDGIGFRCSLCDFECQWSKEYYIHCKGHYGEPPYRCDFLDCKETFDRIHAIVMHKDKHNNERKWACGKCPARFRSRNNLASHRRCHSGAKPFECDICQRKFATKNTMNQHKVTHSDDRPYLCDTCGFATKYQSHLIAHRRIHSGDVYHCHFPGCKYVTPKRSQLKAHMRSHLGIRRFVCPTCGKAFVEKSHLVRHERIHLEQKPFKCTECEYNSARGDKLKDHILRHHGANSTEKSQKYPTVRRQRKISTKMSTLPVNVVPLPHPPFSDTTEDQSLPAKQNPQPLVLSEHGYVRMSAPNDDPSQIQHGRHLGTVLEIPTGLNGQQGISSHVPQQQTMHMPSQHPPTSHQNPQSHQPQQSHHPQHQTIQAQVQQQQHHQQPHIQVLSNMESFAVPPTSTVLVSSNNAHQHQQQQQQHPQHSQQQQQQQQQQHDYGGLGAFMALF